MAEKTYSANDIIGKTLYAKRDVPLVRLPYDDSKPMYTVKAGKMIGVVQTYVSPMLGRSDVYWSFKDATGRNYYARNTQGNFSIEDLKGQGLVDTATQIKEAKEAAAAAAEKENETFGDVITKNIKTLGIIAAVAIIGKAVIDKKL